MVQFGLGDGVGRDGLLGKKSDLVASPLLRFVEKEKATAVSAT